VIVSFGILMSMLAIIVHPGKEAAVYLPETQPGRPGFTPGFVAGR
jgi:hypothetical protein